MKKVGILGGVGPQATSYIYQHLIEIAQIKYKAENNNDYPDVIIASVPVPDFISSTKNLAAAKGMLVDAAKGLESANCKALSIASNTVHILLKDLEDEVKIPFISMIDLVTKECVKRGFKKVALLGTPVLLSSGLYDDSLGKNGIDLIKPDKDQVEVCDEVIRCIIAGESIESVKRDYLTVLHAMFDQKADAIILGCTELPLVVDYEVLGDRVLSSDKILAEGIADFCYS